ncbi:MAG: SIR2 family protein, partial [Clostridia bacterium]|nr:SIR2 family protein [Clostridia bacterium]
MDSISPSDGKLPGSRQLIEQLCDKFRVVAEEQDLLWRVYDRAVEAAGETAVYAWLRRRFWNVKAPYWMEYYARSPWATVWTLNVDDTFESAYSSVATETMRPLQTLNWDDEYRHSRKLNVVHLHGVVDQAAPRRLVFSLREYADSAATSAAWPVNFRDSYGNAPFVILGARMRDEPDIEAVISRRRPTHPAPSFYVSRTISPATRTDLIRWGLVPVELSAEDFVLEWGELSGLDLEQGLPGEQELGMRVGQQFTELKLSRKPAL